MHFVVAPNGRSYAANLWAYDRRVLAYVTGMLLWTDVLAASAQPVARPR